MNVVFVYTNPRHHVDMMAPVMRVLGDRGVDCRAVSISELRGLPTRPIDVPGVTPVRAIPAHLRRRPEMGGSFGVEGTGVAGGIRRLAQLAVWAALGPRLRYLLQGADVVVVPNDHVYPYHELCAGLRARGVPFVLMQEGIRFDLPGFGSSPYGTGGATAIAAWGEASAEYFRRQGAPAASVHVTGTPRFDSVDLDRSRAEGRALMQELGLARAPLLYLSNPIEIQRLASVEEKLAIFRAVLDDAAPVLDELDLPVLVKLHSHEDPVGFRAAAAASRAAARVRVLDDAPLYPVIAAGRAAVVLTSTVGLEAMMFGLPLGVVAVPRVGHAFDYVSRGGAVAIPPGAGAGAAIRALCADGRRPDLGYLESHLADRGRSAARVADLIEAQRPASYGVAS